MSLLSADQIKDLKKKHGEQLLKLKFDSDEIVLRGPSPVEFDRFMDRCAEGPKAKPEAMRELARACVVHPAPEAYDAFLVRKPAAYVPISDRAAELGGAKEDSSSTL